MRLRLREDAPGLLTVVRTGSISGWGRRVQTIAVVNVVVAFLFVPSAVANPFCYIPMVCEVKAAVDFVQDPLGFLLQKLTEANIWFLQKMLELIQNTTKVDLTSAAFLKQYAIIFAFSSLITVALWLIAVGKRAVRGVGLTAAVGEAVGFLVLQFFVNAMTPAFMALLMRAIDEVTDVFEPYATANFKPFLENVLKVMAAEPNEGVGVLIVVNLIMLCGALLMWVELLVRGAAIYVAVALGPVVNAGLVDRDLWGKSKKWFGAVFAIGLSKPILFALLGLGGAILSDSTGSLSDTASKTLVGALILLAAVFASATLYKWLPAFGDEMAQLHHDRKSMQSSGPAAAVDGPAQHANRAMGMHLQDSMVGGRYGMAVGPRASATAGGRAGTASAKAMTGSSASAAGAAGPVGIGVMVAKAGADAVKSKAASSPGAQASGAPAAARPQGNGSDSVVGPTGRGAPAPVRGRAPGNPMSSSPPWPPAAPPPSPPAPRLPVSGPPLTPLPTDKDT